MEANAFDAGMSRLKKRFVETHYERHDRLEDLAVTLQQTNPPASAAQEVESILHKIAGTAGSVGFKELGEAAQQVEVFIRDHAASNQAAIVKVLDAFLDVSLEFCDPIEKLMPQGAGDGFSAMAGTTH
ncbi:Hpt domain-containing protein [Loktanella salsilacus]|jgi:chemotaxis protein histidine kinase CheA|uniref:Hpt domain-containing protein n=1 Tax=Loktanella salsilacus TaxID=195913 RepID=UPI0020B7EDB2|nr:Hpt domain-containing protein [Loktanella salsilacus]UTH46619.1 Hpt domain-containing protein [Loktanella salsilacus]